MSNIKIYDLLRRRVLVTREFARSIQPTCSPPWLKSLESWSWTFSGVDGLAPSFFDELLTIIETCSRDTGEDQLMVKNWSPPTALSSKFEAVGRGHAATLERSADGSWIIRTMR